jgi:pimeloyl-ACP methyl ester carboxylesterase
MKTHQLPNSYEFAQLSAGRCHYRIDGPQTGKTLLLIHGATVPAWEFDRVVPLLNHAGFRTIRLDLFGHGYSARPAVTHDYALFTRQVFELLDYLRLTKEIHLLGHSFGSVVAARLLLQQPECFASLVMNAPMLAYLTRGSPLRLLQVSHLGEWLMRVYVEPLLKRRRTRRYRDLDNGKFVQLFQEQFLVPDFGRSLLSIVRSGVLEDQGETYHALHQLTLPMLILSGADDVVVTPSHRRIVEGFLPNAQSHVIEGAGHALILTHPEQVAGRIIAFLSEEQDGHPHDAGNGQADKNRGGAQIFRQSRQRMQFEADPVYSFLNRGVEDFHQQD